jgi:hypothetical protein
MHRTLLLSALALTACLAREGRYYQNLSQASTSHTIEAIRNPLVGSTIINGTTSIVLKVKKVEHGKLCFAYKGFFPPETKPEEVVDVLRRITFVAEAHDDPQAPALKQRDLLPPGAAPRPFEHVTVVDAKLDYDHEGTRQMRVEANLCMPQPADLALSSKLLTLLQLDEPRDLGFFQPCPSAQVGTRMCIWRLTE